MPEENQCIEVSAANEPNCCKSHLPRLSEENSMNCNELCLLALLYKC